jgi:predicted transcriptional regulator YheO
MTRVLGKAHVEAMVKALRAAGAFSIERTRETVKAVFQPTGKTVYRALKAHSGGWIITHDDNLFTIQK